MSAYLVATVKPWNEEAFHRCTSAYPGKWHIINKQSDLSLEKLRAVKPRCIFFPHWSWRVPQEILSEFECVCFHMTDVPFGRGGSPLQNLILRGCESTQVSALRMVDEMDAGPVYLKRPLSLEGRAVDIFRRSADVIFEMIREIIQAQPAPVSQEGNPVLFKRRSPKESELPRSGLEQALYDHIRMVDAPTYPLAFINWGDWRIEFSEAELDEVKGVSSRVTIRKRKGEE
jgi:methionyl-tRNA formyltransferase